MDPYCVGADMFVSDLAEAVILAHVVGFGACAVVLPEADLDHGHETLEALLSLDDCGLVPRAASVERVNHVAPLERSPPLVRLSLAVVRRKLVAVYRQ